jgi:hypothetical protein
VVREVKPVNLKWTLGGRKDYVELEETLFKTEIEIFRKM